MRSLALDIGDKRTGVAVSDALGILASPLAVITSEDETNLINEILKLVEQCEADCIVVGLPRQLNGELGRQANKVTAIADKLSLKVKQSNLKQLNVHLWDERLSTKAAQRLKSKGSSKRKRHSRAKNEAGNDNFTAKSEVDAIAAAFILQGFLDSHHLE